MKKPFHNIKTQVTAFIITGIIIVAIVWTALYLSEYFAKEPLEDVAITSYKFNLESNTIKENIDSCVRTLTDKGMQIMSDQGFYINIPEDYKYDLNSAYWIKDTINMMPDSFEKIEQDLMSYVNQNLASCVSFDDFRKRGWEISDLESSTNSKIFKEDIGIEVNYTTFVKKSGFDRELSDSIYIPIIRFKRMYEKSIDFVNNNLLRPDFDFNDPFKEYHSGEYETDFEKLDDNTLLITITDTKSKLLDGSKFRLRFVSSFSINDATRLYDVTDVNQDRTLFSPDRLAILALKSGIESSSDNITITQYEVDSVSREGTPSEKVGADVTQRTDITFTTDYPIYRFGPSGTTFDTPATLRIYLNKDQRETSDQFTLLYNGKNGWLPYPNLIDSEAGFLDSLIFGFSEYAVANCDSMEEQTFPGPKAEADRGFWGAWGSLILIIIMILIIVVAFAALPAAIPVGAPATTGATVGPTGAILTGPAGSFIPIAGGPSLVVPASGTIAIPAGTTLGTISAGSGITLASGQMTAASTGMLAGAAGALTSAPLGIGTALSFVASNTWLAVGALAASAWGAYSLWNGAPDAEDTFVITALCDDDITITTKEENGEGECHVADMKTGGSSKVDGTYHVERGESYTVTAAVTDFDWFQQIATAQCEITGLVTTASSENLYDEMGLGAGDNLVCCLTYDGYCLDNYLGDICDGDNLGRTCSEIIECAGAPPLSGEGILEIVGGGNQISYGREGDSFLITYYLPSATENTIVIAHIKSDGAEIDTIELHDDGGHQDGDRDDLLYANTWNSREVLGGTNSKKITWDIEVIYGDVKTVTIDDAGKILVLSGSAECAPMSFFSFDTSLDIILAANQYSNMNLFLTDAEQVAVKMLLTNPFTQHYTDNGINFLSADRLFDTNTITEIRTYTSNNCDYSEASDRLTIVLNNNAESCTQEGSVVQLNPFFTFKSEISQATIGSVLSDFCNYVTDLSFMNSPTVEIKTHDMVTVPSEIPIEFRISDEEYPVDYELLMSYVTVITSTVMNDSIKTHVLNFPNGNWLVQIRATDLRGNVAYSNVVNIITNDTIDVDFSSLSPINIPFGGSVSINLNDYAVDPEGDAIVEWVHYPGFSECVGFNPVVIIGGQVTLEHIKETSCTETITFEAIGTGNRRTSNIVVVNAG